MHHTVGFHTILDCFMWYTCVDSFQHILVRVTVHTKLMGGIGLTSTGFSKTHLGLFWIFQAMPHNVLHGRAREVLFMRHRLKNSPYNSLAY